jgi:subtilase family serine protease
MSERQNHKRARTVLTSAVLAAGSILVPALTSGAAYSQSANGQTPACPGPAAPRDGRCHAVVLDDPGSWQGHHVAGQPAGRPNRGSTTVSGYGPADLQSAYSLGTASAANGTGETVAIVDAYGDPSAASDLATYRTHFGLAQLCSTAVTSGCSGTFTQAYATGTAPSNNSGWAEEESLDVDMVSAVCPRCNILLMEAASNSYSDLARAFRAAASYNGSIVAVSNSYGGSDSSSDATFDGSSYYNFASYPNIAVTASSGDGGYGVEYPAASRYVTAVGGTTLTNAGGGNWSESVWADAGSGCSKYESAPSWQPSTSLCTTRTVADVAADANPSTGVAVYDTDGEPGWMVFGGTSVASPIVASVYALAGTHSPSSLYGNGALRKISSGSNSRRCSTYLCNASDSLGSAQGVHYTYSGTGSLWYNGPTGNGTPQGVAGF